MGFTLSSNSYVNLTNTFRIKSNQVSSASTSAGHGFSAGGVNIPEGPGPLVLLLGLGFGSFLLIFNIQKTKIMTSGPITLREIDGETTETVTDFIFLGSKIIAGGDCSHEYKTRLLLGKKIMTNLDNI